MNSLQILDRLIGFATVSREPNLTLIGFVQDFLAAHGVACRLYHDPDERKANLYASIGPQDRCGVLLSGHTDVVPVDGQRWSSDPFRLQQRGDHWFARGTADMKAFLACALRAAALAAARPLRLPLQLAFSYDEEIGCLGVRSLIEDMRGWHERPRFCVVGEPTGLRIAIGHKGKTALLARCHGRAAHSAYPHLGVNAIHLAADLTGRIRQRQRQIAQQGSHDPGYTVPHTTLHVGVIHGGNALNIIPDCCELQLEVRHLPGDEPASLIEQLRADADAVVADMASSAPVDTPGDARGRIDLEIVQDYPGLETPADSAVVGLAASLTGRRECIKMDFGSEAGLFSSRLGIPTVLCGPGAIEQAHQPDEFIALDQLQRCDAMLEALLAQLT
jgi:acetylornithine deacetylase